MRSPERRGDILKLSDDELPLRYLSPGAFTVLATDPHGYASDPPSAPSQYRLTPTSRRSRNQAFAIIAEPTSSRPGSRSPSPSGRVSPFRGRGFNPIGSRHASPNPSPTPPHDYYGNNNNNNVHPRNNNNNNNNNINSNNSINVSSSHYGSSNSSNLTTLSPRTIRRKRTKLSPQLSKSLTNIGSRVSVKPPPSPRRVYSKTPAFQQLSPITGSSPDTPEMIGSGDGGDGGGGDRRSERKKSSSSSSTSKIPRSRSQPPSRKPSPNVSRSVSPRNYTASTSRENSRPSSRNEPRANAGSRSVSRTASSRNPSPSAKGTPLSPTRAKNKYSNVQAKVNSFHSGGNSNSNHRSYQKPKVPQKPNFDSEASDQNGASQGGGDSKRASSRSNSNLSTYKASVINRNINGKKTSNGNSEQNLAKAKTAGSNGNVNNGGKTRTGAKKQTNKYDEIETVNEPSSTAEEGSPQKTESATKPSGETLPTTVVSSTTSTATQPLKLDLNSEEILKIKPTPMYMDEGRVLSATSVSTAINRMNDTVLDSQTVMKDHNFTKLSPAATAIISMSETDRGKLALDPRTATHALPTVDDVAGKVKGNVVVANDANNRHANHEVDLLLKHRNNVNKLNNGGGGGVENSVGLMQNVRQETATSNGLEGRLDGRTVIATDVKPIRITVKEKPMDPDVQSGNVRLSGSIVNGSITGVRPSLPPPQQPENASNERTAEEKKPTIGNRILSCCKCCKKKPKVLQVQEKHRDESDDGQTKRNIFGCCSKKGKKTESEENIAETVAESEDEGAGANRKCWDRLNCCRRDPNKVSSSSSFKCCPFGKRKTDASWAERRAENDKTTKRNGCGNCCGNFFRKLFCLDSCRCCTKKQKVVEDPVSRRESVMSKKKSLTPTATMPPEEPKSKIDISLVEHTSLMRGAIPVLPVALAWFCLVCNVIVPGTGTIFSGTFCLCLGKPRFSQKDGGKPRIGSFIINVIIGIGQLFTVLFCLVGWGWSIWWGVIMLKIAKKHVKLKLLEESQMEPAAAAAAQVVNQNHLDPERGGIMAGS